jgi:ABC-type transport system involved in multi-copper enzyme maturation permease subunit
MHWAPVSISVVGQLFAYMAMYTIAMIGLSWAKFRRQAV